MNESKAGYIRPGNQRKADFTPLLPGEVLVYADRKNPVLGNKHELKNHNDMAERLRVIAAFKEDIDRDFEVKGRMHFACKQLAERVNRNEKILLSCWCFPRPCHVNIIIDKVKGFLKEINPDHLFLQEKPVVQPPKPAQPELEF
jgi:hypothetical protein